MHGVYVCVARGLGACLLASFELHTRPLISDQSNRQQLLGQTGLGFD